MTVCLDVITRLVASLCRGVREGALEHIPQHTEFIKTVLTIFAKYVLAAVMSTTIAIITNVQCVARRQMLLQWIILWTILLNSEGLAEVASEDLGDLGDLAGSVDLGDSVDIDLDFFPFFLSVDGFKNNC